MYEEYKPEGYDNNTEKCPDSGIVFKHDKEGLSIYITIYSTNNNANEGSESVNLSGDTQKQYLKEV